MPFLDLQNKIGIDIDKWMLLQSSKQPLCQAGRCHSFEKDWVECVHGIGAIRAQKECKVEFDDFLECMHRTKTLERLNAIREQKKKLEKEGKYKAPDFSEDKNTP
ncbi:NADH dehydrogenase [ubiquinone] iron-sulfur protein 5 [Bufo bufo]|uniref:NADH dehydrogenase [ubiquinone] iron-sulfur protein 5 n=1 Tax=Bufo bufo TaxID=8384 RepID=UPI001ABEDABE|nr:NADH dehydrogenase [ubiquinone] iron-sulfur protein 5 [Bufo bufo]XP_040280534.1 NADH dehydrogenase [ubiquinone] iron-sulfur protein 5 [Bufo bufo]